MRRPCDKHLIALAVITAIGVVVRFVGYGSSHLMHDDLSAICRLYGTLSDTIAYGVYEDGHPAGVQVFLWLWAQIGGTGQTWMRLPFVLMGIACIPLTYCVARQWYNKNAGLAAASVIAVSQYTIFHSVSVRPYIVGLFFMLILLLCWTAIVLRHDRRWLPYIIFALTAAACAYTHAFAALTAALTALAGLLLCQRDQRLRLLAACGLAVALFLPHLPITLHQLLDIKGVGGWLGKPTPMLLPRYGFYLFHFSYVAIGTGIISFLLCSKWNFQPRKQTTAFTLWLLPLLIGYCYSVWANPVLQYSCLIFSFPFLLLTLASLIPETTGWRGISSLTLYVVVMILTLYGTRQHYQFFHNQVYQAACDKAKETQQRFGKDNVALWLDIPDKFAAYYGIETPHSDTIGRSYLLAAKIEQDELERLMQRFPAIIEHQDCAEGEIYLLARERENLWKRELYYQQEGQLNFDSSEEFTAIYDSCYPAPCRFADIDISVNDSCTIVIEVLLGRHQKAWLSGMGHLRCRATNIIKNSGLCRLYRIKAYVWNPDHKHLPPTHYAMTVSASNPWIYSITEPSW